MKANIICFSQSGNTKKIADNICQGIREAGADCRVSEMTDSDPSLAEDCDLLGIGCPVFFYKEPFNVAEFMEALPAGKSKPAFVFITHGSIPGVTLESMWKRLEEKDYLVLGGHNTYADAFLPFYPYPTLTTGHPDEQDRAEARAFGKAMAETGMKIKAGESVPEPAPPATAEGWWTEEAVMLSREALSQVMPALSVNPEKCIQCQACEQACPVDGISVLEEPVRIQDPCVYCFHCAKVCPELAIEADWSMLVDMAPASYARYRKALDEAASKGEFRWLMDPESLNCGDPLHKQMERKKAETENKKKKNRPD